MRVQMWKTESKRNQYLRKYLQIMEHSSNMSGMHIYSL